MNIHRPFSRTVALGLLVIALQLAAHQTARAKDTWIKVQSQNFTLVGNASEKDIRQVATRLEQFREIFGRLFPRAKFETPVPTTVIVFKSMGSYKPFNPGNNAGYFQKGDDVNYITLTNDPTQNPFSVIYHEYVHLLIDNTSGNVPTWFNEGLAEYYSTFTIEEDRKVHLGELIPYHLLTLREDKLYPLRRLFGVNRYSPEYNEGSKRGMFYAESWAVVHYLLQANNGTRVPQLGQFLGLIAANVPTDDAFKRAFAMDIDSFEKELKKYIEGHTFRLQVATFEHKLEVDSQLQSSPVTEAEAQAYLGDLLLHTNQLTEAEARLQQALAADPKLPMAHASLGIVRMRQGKFDEAKKSLQEAIAAESANYLTHYYYAYALSREAMDSMNVVRSYSPESANLMRAELRKAIQLNPTFTESYSLLAFVNMVTGEELDESIALLQKALTISPGRQELSFHLAQIYMRQQKFDLARQTVEPLRSSSDREMQKQAEMLLASIKRYQDQMAQYEAMQNSRPSDRPELKRAETSGQSSVETDAKTASDYLREALRPVGAGEQRIQGVFMKLDCDNNKGVAFFIVQSSDRAYRIRATSLEQVELRAYTQAPAEVGCGARKNPENVVLTFKPATDPKDTRAKIDGDAIAMELVPKDFQLKPN